MLISDEYRALNAQLHRDRPDYGTSGHKWADAVMMLAKERGANTVLDYGCGKRTLRGALPLLNERDFRLYEYDPAIPGLDAAPSPADLVVCTDVLEHIEADCLNAVLDDLRRCTRKVAFLEIATRPAVKTLADGRNAHLIVEPPEWWLPKLDARWSSVGVFAGSGSFVYIGVPRA
jgi:hypothetical protein